MQELRLVQTAKEKATIAPSTNQNLVALAKREKIAEMYRMVQEELQSLQKEHGAIGKPKHNIQLRAGCKSENEGQKEMGRRNKLTLR